MFFDLGHKWEENSHVPCSKLTFTLSFVGRQTLNTLIVRTIIVRVNAEKSCMRK